MSVIHVSPCQFKVYFNYDFSFITHVVCQKSMNLLAHDLSLLPVSFCSVFVWHPVMVSAYTSWLQPQSIYVYFGCVLCGISQYKLNNACLNWQWKLRFRMFQINLNWFSLYVCKITSMSILSCWYKIFNF